MIAYAGMLVKAAIKAGIKVPTEGKEIEDVWHTEENKNKYPHFYTFCLTQLARPVVYHGEHWDNAKVIADIPEDEILKLTIKDLIEKGLSIVCLKDVLA